MKVSEVIYHCYKVVMIFCCCGGSVLLVKIGDELEVCSVEAPFDPLVDCLVLLRCEVVLPVSCSALAHELSLFESQACWVCYVVVGCVVLLHVLELQVFSQPLNLILAQFLAEEISHFENFTSQVLQWI